ncbi:hypothetical protein JCM10207_002490 [Rhodosporidiobolus poonsookiae]
MPSASPPPSDALSDTSLSSSSSHLHARLPLADDSDDPSFASEHVLTSTPRKPTRSSAPRGSVEDDDDPLHASDTESINLDNDAEGRTGYDGDTVRALSGGRLTQRSLLKLSASSQHTGSPFAGSSAGERTATGRLHDSLPLGRVGRSDQYAPSPSTGSSTLVDREDDTLQWHDKKRRVTLGAGGVSETTLRARLDRSELSSRPMAVREEEDEDRAEEEERATVVPLERGASEDGSSSSPRPPRRSRIGNLASYVDAKMSSASAAAASTPPRRSPSSSARQKHGLPPATPAAPGAYPPSARKPARSSPTHPASTFSSSSQLAPPTRASPSAQIHDAFSRLITGPDGALMHSAERRAAVASSGGRQVDLAAAERYGFVPSGALPVERSYERRGGRDRSAAAVIEEGEQEQLERPPSKLERALRQLSQAQRESAERAAHHAADGDEEPFSAEDDEDDPVATAHAQRSAIDFAMARSFALHDAQEFEEQDAALRARKHVLEDALAEESFSDDQDLRQSARRRGGELRSSVRFASPPAPSRSRSRTPSPPPSRPPPLVHRRSTTPPSSPPLPPLPSPIFPESPEPARTAPTPSHQRRASFLRRSQSVDLRGQLRRDEQASFALPPPAEYEYATTAAVDVSLARSPRRQRTTSSPTSTPPRPPAASSSRSRTSPSHQALPPSFSPPTSQRTPPHADDPDSSLTLPHLVSQLSAAVAALASSSPASPQRPSRLNAQGLPSSPRAEDEQALRRELERRRKESEGRRRALEGEMREIEKAGESGEDARAEMLNQLAETYEVEQELGFKVDELRRSIEGMGQLVGEQVAQVVGDTIRNDTRQRLTSFAWIIALQLLLFLVFLRLANLHSSTLFQSLYHDPFLPPSLFHLPAHAFYPAASLDPHLSAETLAALSPFPPSTAPSTVTLVFSAAKAWAGRVLGLAPALTARAVPSSVLTSVPS